MSRRRWCILAALLGVVALLHAGEPPRRLERFDSRHYRVQTDLERPTADAYARHLDVVFDAYQERFRDFPRAPAGRMDVYLLGAKRDYLALLASKGSDGAGTAGMFTGTLLAAWTENQPRARVLAVLRHEGFHQFAAARIGGNLPVWANEGLAEYFAEGVVGERRMLTGLVRPPRLHGLQTSLRQNGCLPWETLLGVTRQQWDQALHAGAGGVLAAPSYSQAWSMVQFLVHGQDGKYRDRFHAYLLRLSRAGPREDPRLAFEQAFRPDTPAALEAAWKQYLLDLEPDPLSRAVYELELLAAALRHLHGQMVKVSALDDLYAQAEAVGHAVVPKAQSVFFNPAGAAAARLELAPAKDAKTPPALTAQLPDKVTLRVTWTVDRKGFVEEAVECE